MSGLRGKTVVPGVNDLGSRFPEIAREWDVSKNALLSPDGVTGQSNRKVWWRCELGHSYQAAVASRTAERKGCLFCAGKRVLPGFNDLASLLPAVAAQWHPTRNGTLTAADVTCGSGNAVETGKLDVGVDPSFNEVSYIYNGDAWSEPDGYAVKAVDGTTEFNTVVRKYFTSPDDSSEEGSEDFPKDAGTYYVQYSITQTGYDTLVSAKIPFVISPKPLTITFTVTGAKYDGRSHNFVNEGYTVDGRVNDTDTVDVSFENGSGIAVDTYTVKAKISGNNNYCVNYADGASTATAKIDEPDCIVVKAEDYMSGYTMVYVFVENDARVTYDGKKLYEITKLGYDFKPKEGKTATDPDAYTVCRPETLAHTGYKVYAILVPGTATADVVLKPYNQGLAGTLSKNQKMDVNASTKIDLADAVVIATEYNAVDTISSKLSLYVATILRSDVDGNGKVEAKDATNIVAKVKEIPTGGTGNPGGTTGGTP